MPVWEIVEDFSHRMHRHDSIMHASGCVAGLLITVAATRVFLESLRDGCAFFSISDQFPMSDEDNAHHCHTLRHKRMFPHVSIISCF